jgi:hypothetical protein
MVDITNFTDSDSHKKVLQMESVDTYNVKEKITVSASSDNDLFVISATEFSKNSNYENTINLALTKNEFYRFLQFFKNLLLLVDNKEWKVF